ncbi:hypothetical protein LSH36_165g04024 [Paralvinella palmiformis]|uniref:Annexin n=1 Tax=Paralvinella palmiformis TaxID=53620 RepID=A0AAD9JTG3_9ANNE|nr:hypothetical protein LSH36_165g04024 [Paralvinella palmiformis]
MASGDTSGRLFGTVQPADPFDPEKDADILKKAMKGLGTDEKAIIDIVSHCSNQQRQELKKMFKTMFGKDLIKELKSELSGDFEQMVVALFMTPPQYDAWSLRKAMKGAGTKESVLTEMLCTRTNSEIREMINIYKTEIGRDLEKDISSETSGHFKNLLISCLQANRAELTPAQQEQAKKDGPMAVVNHDQAREDAKALYKAGEGKLGTDESTFLKILAIRHIYQLQQVFKEYEKLTGHTILKAIEAEFSGDIESGMKAVAQCAMNLQEYFADKLQKAMKGAGTDEGSLMRVVVSRSEIDLGNIKMIYEKKYGQPLAKTVKSETSGDFGKLLLKIIR